MGDGDMGSQGQRWRFDPAALEALLSVVTRRGPAEEEVAVGGTRQERSDARRSAVLTHARDIARPAV